MSPGQMACGPIGNANASNRKELRGPCGAEGDRTPDLMSAIHALSQLSYSPDDGCAAIGAAVQRVSDANERWTDTAPHG